MKKVTKILSAAMAVCMLATVGASCSFERDTGGTSVDTTKVQLLVGNFNGGYGNA